MGTQTNRNDSSLSLCQQKPSHFNASERLDKYAGMHTWFINTRIERDRRLSHSRKRAVTDLRVTDVGGTWTTNKVQNEGSILSAF